MEQPNVILIEPTHPKKLKKAMGELAKVATIAADEIKEAVFKIRNFQNFPDIKPILLSQEEKNVIRAKYNKARQQRFNARQKKKR